MKVKVSELISKLQEMQSQCGDVEVKIYSDDYVCDLHNVKDVTAGYFDGWKDHEDVIGICVTK